MWREKQREEEIEKERKRALIREIRQLEAERIEDRNYKLPVNYSCIFLLVSNEKKNFSYCIIIFRLTSRQQPVMHFLVKCP